MNSGGRRSVGVGTPLIAPSVTGRTRFPVLTQRHDARRVRSHHAVAIGFYRRAGFKALGARRFNVGGQDYDDTITGVATAPPAPPA